MGHHPDAETRDTDPLFEGQSDVEGDQPQGVALGQTWPRMVVPLLLGAMACVVVIVACVATKPNVAAPSPAPNPLGQMSLLAAQHKNEKKVYLSDKEYHELLKKLVKDKPQDSELPAGLRGGNFTMANVKAYFDSPNHPCPFSPQADMAFADVLDETDEKDESKEDGKPLRGRKLQYEEIMNAAASAWSIIQDSAPVMTMDNDFATAVPEDTAWHKMKSWKRAQTSHIGVASMNGYQWTTIDVSLKLRFEYNGHFEDSRAAYLTNIHAEVVRIEVMWGFHVDVDIKFTDPTNIGSNTPEAQIGAVITFKYGSIAWEETQSVYVNFKGYGGWSVHYND